MYLSIDIETDGPIPGANSMLQLGAAAFHPNGELLGKTQWNLEELYGARPNPSTMDWWKTQGDLYEETRKDTKEPTLVMEEFVKFALEQKNKTVSKGVTVVAYPASFDWMFVYWYLIKLLGNAYPFGMSALDIKSYVAGKLGTNFRNTVKKNMPREWFQNLPKHTHRAVDDAYEQGVLFMRILNAET